MSPGLSFATDSRANGVLRLALVGEIDVTTGESCAAALHGHLQEDDVRQLVLDLSGLTFIDSNGVRILLDTHRAAEVKGVRLSLVNLHPYIHSVLSKVGVAPYLNLDGG